MKVTALLFAGLVLVMGQARAAGPPSALDLLGKWEGSVEFGKNKLTLILRVTTNAAGRVEVGIDMPEQGQKGIPADALLFNPPDVRLELDRFGTSYAGKVNEAMDEIKGAFEEGPGGRPAPVNFKRSTAPDEPAPEQTFFFASGEAPDIRGYWKGQLEAGPGFKMLAILSIGRLTNGTFRGSLDLPEQGAKDIPATSITASNNTARFEWKGFRAVYHATLGEEGKKLSGSWEQAGRSNQLTFERLPGPFKLVPDNLSFEPGEDIRGYWKGTLDSPAGKMRLEFRIGRAPDGSYSGTIASLDQGGRQLPVSSASFSAPKVVMEWKGIRGKYEGTLSGDGKSIEGKWEQFGAPQPLKLERISKEELKGKS